MENSSLYPSGSESDMSVIVRQLVTRAMATEGAPHGAEPSAELPAEVAAESASGRTIAGTKRPQSIRPVDPRLLDLRPRLRNVATKHGMQGAWSAAIRSYSSSFLELLEPPCHEARLASAGKTYALRNFAKSCSKPNVLNLDVEVCVLSMWMVDHGVMALYDCDEPRGRMALTCYSAHVAGKWCFPGGDLLIIPGKDDAEELLTTLKDIEKGLLASHRLQGNYNVPLQLATKQQVFDKANSLAIKNKLKCAKCLQPIKVFKPIFHKMYFTFEDENCTSVKIFFALELLQRACLVIIQLIELAMQCERHGSSLLLSQLLLLLTEHLDALVSSTALAKVYTHEMSRWYLANCFYNAWQSCQSQGEIVEELTSSKTELKSFLDALKQFGQYFPEKLQKIDDWLQMVLHYKKTIPVESLQLLQSLSLPSHWIRSAFRMHHISLYAALEKFDAAVELMRKDEVLDWKKIDERLKSVYLPPLPAHHTCVYEDVLALTHVVAARSCRYRATWLAASALPSQAAAEKEKLQEQDALFKEMQRFNVKAYYAFQRLALSDIKLRKAYAEFMKEFLATEVFLQLEQDGRQAQGTNSLSNITLALRLASSLWDQNSYCSSPTTSSPVDTWHDESLQQLMAIFCTGASMLYLKKYQREPSNQLQHVWLSNARYYHALTALYMKRDGVERALLLMFANTWHIFRNCFLSQGESAEMFQRHVLLLRRAVDALPVLWEYSGNHQQSPSTYDHILIEKAVLPFPLMEIKDSVSADDYRVFSDLVDRMQLVPTYSKSSSGDTVELASSHKNSMQLLMIELNNLYCLEPDIDIRGSDTEVDRLGTSVKNIVHAIFRIMHAQKSVGIHDEIWEYKAAKVAKRLTAEFMYGIYEQDDDGEMPLYGAVAVVIGLLSAMFAFFKTELTGSFKKDSVQKVCVALLNALDCTAETSKKLSAKNRLESSLEMLSVRHMLMYLVPKMKPCPEEFLISVDIYKGITGVINSAKSESRETSQAHLKDALLILFGVYCKSRDTSPPIPCSLIISCTASAVVKGIITAITFKHVYNVSYSNHAQALKFEIPKSVKLNPLCELIVSKFEEIEDLSGKKLKGECAGEFASENDSFCGIEQFHEYEEIINYRGKDFSMEKTFEKVFEGLICNEPAHENEMLLISMKHILEEALRYFLQPESLSSQPPEFEQAIKEASSCLNSTKSTSSNISQALQKIDSLFFDGRTSMILRGNLPQKLLALSSL